MKINFTLSDIISGKLRKHIAIDIGEQITLSIMDSPTDAPSVGDNWIELQRVDLLDGKVDKALQDWLQSQPHVVATRVLAMYQEAIKLCKLYQSLR